MKKFSESQKIAQVDSHIIEPAKGPQKETGQLGGFNDETGAQSRVDTNRTRLLPLNQKSPPLPRRSGSGEEVMIFHVLLS